MIRNWNMVEAHFASAYGLDVRDMFNMSWRRFRVLFNASFSWKEEEGPKRIADTVDWSSAKHITVAELGQSLGVTVNRVPVRGGEGNG